MVGKDPCCCSDGLASSFANSAPFSSHLLSSHNPVTRAKSYKLVTVDGEHPLRPGQPVALLCHPSSSLVAVPSCGKASSLPFTKAASHTVRSHRALVLRDHAALAHVLLDTLLPVRQHTLSSPHSRRLCRAHRLCSPGPPRGRASTSCSAVLASVLCSCAACPAQRTALGESPFQQERLCSAVPSRPTFTISLTIFIFHFLYLIYSCQNKIVLKVLSSLRNVKKKEIEKFLEIWSRSELTKQIWVSALEVV